MLDSVAAAPGHCQNTVEGGLPVVWPWILSTVVRSKVVWAMQNRFAMWVKTGPQEFADISYGPHISANITQVSMEYLLLVSVTYDMRMSVEYWLKGITLGILQDCVVSSLSCTSIRCSGTSGVLLLASDAEMAITSSCLLVSPRLRLADIQYFLRVSSSLLCRG